MNGHAGSAAASETTRAAVSVVLVVWNRLELTRACLESLRSATVLFDLCVVDNGSTDGTRAWFEDFPLPYTLSYQRNESNLGLIPALNQGARAAKGDVLCFLHNDTEMRDPRWSGRHTARHGAAAGHRPVAWPHRPRRTVRCPAAAP